MKRSISIPLIALAFVLGLALVACSQTPATPAANTAPSSSSGVSSGTSTGGSSAATTSESATTPAAATTSTDSKKSPATLAKYAKIKNGMTYDEVVKVLGPPHVTIGKQTAGSISVAIYGWYGADEFTTLVVNITNGKVSAKNQSGLK